MSRQRIASNLVILGSGHLVTWTISGVTTIFVSRYLGPVRLGEFTLALSITAILGIVVGLGMDTLLIRTVARAAEPAGLLVSAAMIARAILAIPVPAVIYAYAHLAHLSAETSAAAYILAVSMALDQFSGVLLATFQGYERMSFRAINSILLNLVLFALAMLVIVLHRGVVAFAAAFPLTSGLLLALNLHWARRFVRLTWRVSWHDLQDVIVRSFAFWATTLFVTFYTYIDSIILGALAGAGAVGIYAPATRVFALAFFLPTIVGWVTLPMLSRLGVEAGSDFDRMGRKTLSLLLACGVPVTIGLATFAEPIILVVFRSAYHSAVPVLKVLSLCIPFTFLNMQFADVLTARDQQWRWTAVMAVSCVANPAINVVLIPLAMHQWHNGALGAALALLVTEVLMVMYGTVVLRDLVFHASVGRAIFGTLVAGSAQFAVVSLLSSPQLLLLLGEGLGAAVYLVTAIALGSLPRRDVELLWHTVLRRTQRTAI